MTTNSRGNSRTPQDLAELRQQLGKQNADAVAKFVDGRIDAAVRPLAERLAALEPGTPGRATAAQAVRAAAADPTPDTVEAAEQAVAAAEGNATPPAPPSAPQAPAQPVAPGPVSGVAQASAATSAAVPDGRTLAGAHARIDQMEACMGEVQAVSATAFASARAGGDAAWRRAAQWALGAFLATFVIYGLFVLVDNRPWSWAWAIGLPAVVAGIVAAVTFVASREDGPSTQAVASADAIVARWATPPAQQQGTTPASAPQTPQQQGTQARAGAHASTR